MEGNSSKGLQRNEIIKGTTKSPIRERARLDLKQVSCKQHILYVSYFYIHSASLCLLVGAFNPFTFKVIINMYVLIAILLIVLDLFL